MEWKAKMFDFVGKRRWFILGSLVIIIAGIISLSIPGGLKPGVDFEGGTAITLGPKEGETLTLEQVQQKLKDLGHSEAANRVQTLGSGDFFIRTRELGQTDQERLDEQNKLKDGLAEIGEIREFGAISAMVASQTVRNAAIAVAVGCLAIMLYIAWAFRKMPSPAIWAASAIIALIFDILVTLGVFSFLGRILHWEIDPMFVTAMLAIIGYAINDTIVVFDRIRENRLRGTAPDFRSVVNLSLNETMTRSLNTTITTLLALFAVAIFVGGPIQTFALALIVGFAAGAYGSIFIAAQLVLIWDQKEWRGLSGKIPLFRRIRTQKA